jgi:peptide/nickel transport system permease protein
MLRYITVRLLHSVLVVVVVSSLVFAVTHIVGDPVRLLLPLNASQEQYEKTRHQIGYDRPVLEQYVDFGLNALRGDFGESWWQRRPAMEILLERVPATLELVLAAFALALFIGIPLGLTASLRPNSIFDKLCTILSFGTLSLPSFWLGFMLVILFAVRLRWVPSFGRGSLLHLILPAITMSARSTGRVAQIVRSSMLDEMHRQYMYTALSKGLKRNTAVLRHALANAAIPIVTISGWQLGLLLGGATVVVETVFSWPGLGQLAVQAIERHDLPLVQANVLLVALMVATLNLVVDILYAYLNPRVRLG